MSKRFMYLFLSLFILYLLACSSDDKNEQTQVKQQTTEIKTKPLQQDSTAKQTDTISKTEQSNQSVERPQYMISVTQSGKKLGDIVLELFPDIAPKHCRNFDSLVSIKFYDGTAFHRVIPGFMIQGGDPNSKNKPEEMWGMGDNNQKKIPAEFSKLKHERGTVSAARSQDINSATSQFFICVAPAPHLDGQYSIFGKVISGMEVADKIVNTPRNKSDRPLKKVEMKIKKISKK